MAGGEGGRQDVGQKDGGTFDRRTIISWTGVQKIIEPEDKKLSRQNIGREDDRKFDRMIALIYFGIKGPVA